MQGSIHDMRQERQAEDAARNVLAIKETHPNPYRQKRQVRPRGNRHTRICPSHSLYGVRQRKKEADPARKGVLADIWPIDEPCERNGTMQTGAWSRANLSKTRRQSVAQ